MTHFVAHDTRGFYVWRLVNGKYRLPLEPHFPTPRAAMAYRDELDAPTPKRAGDVPDLTGFWGAASRDVEPRRPSGSPVAQSPLPGAG